MAPWQRPISGREPPTAKTRRESLVNPNETGIIMLYYVIMYETDYSKHYTAM